jgi:glycosyltransferase involved in cell wall biosynthesis
MCEHYIPAINNYLTIPASTLRKAGGRRTRGVCPRVSTTGRPLVSVITIVRNNKDTILQAIRSVLDQTYPFVEYLIVDGVSTDGTLDIIKQHEDRIDYWLSEPDLGTSDAMNKGISYAHGELSFWLASDDWLDPEYIETAVDALTKSGADFVYGDLTYYTSNIPQFTQVGDPNYGRSITYMMPRLNTPSWVIKTKCFREVGLLDFYYELASDYELALRLYVHGAKGTYDSRLCVHHRLGGVSTINHLGGLLEVREAAVYHGFSKAKATYGLVYCLARRVIRNVASACLPASIYKKLLSYVRRDYQRNSRAGRAAQSSI